MAFSQDVLQRPGTSGVRDVVVEREGEGEVRLSIGSDVDAFLYATSDGVVIDRVDKLGVTFVRQDLGKLGIALTSNWTLLRATPK